MIKLSYILVLTMLRVSTSLLVDTLVFLTKACLWVVSWIVGLTNRLISWRNKNIEALMLREKLKGHNAWRKTRRTGLYDYSLVGELENTMKRYILQSNTEGLMDFLSSHTDRNIGGIMNPLLYERSLVGTKELIHYYQERIIETFQEIQKSPNITLEEKLQFFQNLKRTYGRTALLLSGGGVFALFHSGVIKALLEEGLMPNVISGSSGGALICAILGCTKKELVLERRPKKTNIFRKLYRLVTKGNLLEVSSIVDFLRSVCGDETFREAYDKTGWVINIVVCGDQHEEYRVLNYMSAPNVLVWSAAVASCSVPFLFGATKIMCKNSSGKITEWFPKNKEFQDGTLGRDLPKRKMAELFNANHFIVSQANPIIVHFIDTRRQYMASRAKWFTKIFYQIARLITMEVSHRLKQIVSLSIIPKAFVKFFNLITQEYEGHITLKYNPGISDYANVITNPDRELALKFMKQGEKACYTEMSRIRVFLKIEKSISHTITSLKGENSRNERKLSVIKEQNIIANHKLYSDHEEHDKEDSLQMSRSASILMPTGTELAQVHSSDTGGVTVVPPAGTEAMWKYIQQVDEKALNSGEHSPVDQHPDNNNFIFGQPISSFMGASGGQADEFPLKRVKSSDSYHSLSSLGGTLK